MRQPDSKFQYIQQAPTDICLLVPHIWKSGVQNYFSLAPLVNPVLYPHLKIRGAAPASECEWSAIVVWNEVSLCSVIDPVTLTFDLLIPKLCHF